MDFGLSAEERFGSDTQGVRGLSSRKSWWVVGGPSFAPFAKGGAAKAAEEDPAVRFFAGLRSRGVG
jgi:hypothetical protein